MLPVRYTRCKPETGGHMLPKKARVELRRKGGRTHAEVLVVLDTAIETAELLRWDSTDA